MAHPGFFPWLCGWGGGTLENHHSNLTAIFPSYEVGNNSEGHEQSCRIKGIPVVSRDWGILQMILLDKLEVFNISASCYFYFVAVFIQ